MQTICRTDGIAGPTIIDLVVGADHQQYRHAKHYTSFSISYTNQKYLAIFLVLQLNHGNYITNKLIVSILLKK